MAPVDRKPAFAGQLIASSADLEIMALSAMLAFSKSAS
jgi:hypothetical protein